MGEATCRQVTSPLSGRGAKLCAPQCYDLPVTALAASLGSFQRHCSFEQAMCQAAIVQKEIAPENADRRAARASLSTTLWRLASQMIAVNFIKYLLRGRMVIPPLLLM